MIIFDSEIVNRKIDNIVRLYLQNYPLVSTYRRNDVPRLQFAAIPGAIPF